MVALLITKLQNTNKMTTKNETPKNNFNATIGNTVLCDGLLIPMTNFVFAIKEKEPKAKNFFSFLEISNYEKESYKKIINYAKFLEQPLKLEIFVPCDEYGEIIKLDYEHLNESNSWSPDEIKLYEKAKRKILIEHPLSSLEIIQDYINAKSTIETFVSMQFGRGRLMKLNKNGLSAIFG